MSATRKEIPIGGIWLMDGPKGEINVLVERDGVWYCAIRELYLPGESTISHCISASGIESLGPDRRVDWLMDAPAPKEAKR